MALPDLLEKVNTLKKDTVEWRRELHMIPEPGFAEHKTGEFLIEKLSSFGFAVKTGVARTGIVAEFGEGSPCIGIRAEMDGYSVQESLNLAFASKNPGYMHACGHDANMACVLAVAKLYSEANLAGRLRIIMQPSSESVSEEDKKSGSNKMIEEGVLEGLDYLLSLHVDATINSGSAGVLSNRMEERIEDFSILLSGSEEAGDWHATQVGARVIAALFEKVLSHETYKDALFIESLEPLENTGRLRARIRGRYGNLGRDTQSFFDKSIKEACGVCSDAGGQFDFQYQKEQPKLFNCDSLVKVVQDAASDVMGEDFSKIVQRKAWSDDFFPFSSRVPSALVLLGVGVPSTPRILHTNSFDVDESALGFGTAILFRAVQVLVSSGSN